MMLLLLGERGGQRSAGERTWGSDGANTQPVAGFVIAKEPEAVEGAAGLRDEDELRI